MTAKLFKVTDIENINEYLKDKTDILYIEKCRTRYDSGNEWRETCY
jgi:hypothetical protein